jgi:hypothetical protein
LSSGALSPLTSPMLNSGLMTAHNSPDIPSPVPLPPSPRERVHERGDLEWPVTTVMPPYTDIYCECSNNCPDCNRPRHPATLALAGISSYGLAPAHVPNTTMRDPRSPFGSRTAVPMAFEQ